MSILNKVRRNDLIKLCEKNKYARESNRPIINWSNKRLENFWLRLYKRQSWSNTFGQQREGEKVKKNRRRGEERAGKKIEAENEKEKKKIALEERKLEIEVEERDEERRGQTGIEEKRLMLKIEDRENFERKMLIMQAKIGCQKDVEIPVPRTRWGKHFDL